ncbi:glycosyltransferase family 4 protein [Paucibacter sp. DJ2R-2]|uniref:glycosyltransferase family 4 protein n=1 Tax=Paucibacter sp. DJ2R-2 TaxID=2893558 RepID=UPI0021E3D48A|nr:glycosyltransferase family 4 protein [Paucibacter sp. DJ2R-2]MCV2438630.1 glycosyltransferase family 4 protein [Paucibacter sp. DJ2R-2]
MARVVQISFHRDPQGRAPAQLLQVWPTVPQLAQAAAAAGADVAVVQACASEEQLRQGGIGYHFLPCDSEPERLAKLLDRLRHELVHVQGLGFVQQVRALASLVPGRPMVLQDRADAPPRPWHWPAWRRALKTARGLMFCAREQALPFRRRGLIAAQTRIYEVPGSSCAFETRDPAAARADAQLVGEPCLLWVAHLDRNKDPLTVLDGVALAVPRLPGLQMWLCYGRSPLHDAVRERMRDPLLAGRVHLLGAQPHARIETLMAAADILVQGSHREATGYSVIEALACGLGVAVTDIPSFRALTGGCEAARLWPAGDASRLADALVELAALPATQRRALARARFDSHCSVEALGRRLMAAYQDLLAV